MTVDSGQLTAKKEAPEKIQSCIHFPVELVRRLDIAVAHERLRRAEFVRKSDVVAAAVEEYLDALDERWGEPGSIPPVVAPFAFAEIHGAAPSLSEGDVERLVVMVNRRLEAMASGMCGWAGGQYVEAYDGPVPSP